MIKSIKIMYLITKRTQIIFFIAEKKTRLANLVFLTYLLYYACTASALNGKLKSSEGKGAVLLVSWNVTVSV